MVANVWPKKRLKYAVSLRRTRVDGTDEERPYVGLEQIASGTGRLVATASAAESARATPTAAGESLSNTFEPGDVLFGKLRPYLAKAWIAEFAGRCTTELVVMQPTDFDARFLCYVCLSRDFVDAVDASTFGSKMPRADWDFIGNMPVPLPTLRCQRAIADYLDRETARLDGLVAAKERVLRLLAEKRRALITRAVTCGLNPRVPLRDSGIPWLGELPAHWRLMQFKFVTMRVDVGIAEAATHAYSLTGVPILRSTNVRADKLDNIDLLYIEPWFAQKNSSKTIHAGDIVTVRTGNTGVSAAVPKSLDGCQCFTMLMSTLVAGHVPEFFSAYLNSTTGQNYFQLEALGTAQNNISVPILKDMPVLVPPVSEQHAIVAHIERETAKVDAMRAATERTITLLKERRAALIAAAVTGHAPPR
ncbi:MAG: restriction endonuclease subunit S [Candidatus Binatia bacterium]